jgi:pimeloyl-ACP methyl ester carboxylesterase
LTAAPLPLHVEVSGREGGPDTETFLLIHGYGACTFTWRFWAPRLAERGRVVMVDLKGFGKAQKPDDGRYAPDDQAELVFRLIEEHDLRRLTIAGHSLGGGVTLLTALRLHALRDDRLERMVIVSGAAYAQKLPPFVRLADFPRLSSAAFTALGAHRIVRAVLEQIVYDPTIVDDEQVRGYAEPLGTPEAVSALLETARLIQPPDLDAITARYPELDVPTLLMWGRSDRVVPLAVGERLERELPKARLHVLERCGHIPAEELPEESYAVLERFLEHGLERR